MVEEFISYFSMHLVDEVIEKTRELLAKTPHDPKLHRDLGHAFFKKGQYQAAYEAFAEAVRYDPRNAGIFLAVGRCCELLGDTSGAIAAFESARDLQADWPDPYFWLGKVYHHQHRLTEAKASLRKALDMNPRFRDAMYSLSLVHEDEKDYPAAISMLKSIIALPGLPVQGRNPFPYDIEPLFDDPVLLKESIRQLEEAVRVHPGFADLHYKLGLAYRRLGNKALAMEQFRQALKLNPNYHLARHYYWHWEDDREPVV